MMDGETGLGCLRYKAQRNARSTSLQRRRKRTRQRTGPDVFRRMKLLLQRPSWTLSLVRSSLPPLLLQQLTYLHPVLLPLLLLCSEANLMRTSLRPSLTAPHSSSSPQNRHSKRCRKAQVPKVRTNCPVPSRETPFCVVAGSNLSIP